MARVDVVIRRNRKKRVKAYHLTAQHIYDTYIKSGGLKLNHIDEEWTNHWELPIKRAIFCWPIATNKLIKDWVIFNKAKTGNLYDDYVLLELSVSPDHVIGYDDDYDISHSLTVSPSGSHGKTDVDLHQRTPMYIITKKVPPKYIKPVKEINTFVITDK